MEYFVRRAGRVMRTRVKYDEEAAVPLTTSADCLVHQARMDVGDRFVAPGIVISQKNGLVSGKRASGMSLFSFPVEKTLNNFIVDKQRLFALDRTGKAHIYHFDGTTPEIHDIHHQPLGWCVVPNTRMLVTWNVLSLRVTDPDKSTDLFLKGHRSRVTAAVAASSTVATGDMSGQVCVWYVASWKRFHDIKTGSQPVEQIVMTDYLLALRTSNTVQQYDTTTGKKTFGVGISATAIEYTSRGLVVAHDKRLELFANKESTIVLEHGVSRLLRSVHSRIWCVKDRHFEQLDLSDAIEKWTDACLRWIRQPRFPFHHKWPTLRYMDVLALAADEWLPAVDVWDPPRTWFRHQRLKQAVWKWSVAHNAAFAIKWMFLPKPSLQSWFEMCIAELVKRTETFDYNNHTVSLLEHVCRRKRIVEESVYKWCWFHHGKMRVRAILLRLICIDAQLLNIVASDPGCAVSIMCFRTETIQDMVEAGFVCTFIRLLEAYHTRFCPTDETRKVYQCISNYVFTSMVVETCDIPMTDTGRWTPVRRFMPTDVGKYIKTTQGVGFVTRVVLKPTFQTVYWRPITTDAECELSARGVHVWSYHFKRAPHTMLECALTLLNAEKWSRSEAFVPFRWFESEVGAFECHGQLLHVLDKSMRVVQAVWDETGASIETATSMTVRESEQLPITFLREEWSYIADAAYELTPMRLKVCSFVSKKQLELSSGYASELFSCCPSDTIVQEHRWDINTAVTASTSDTRSFFVGMKNGAVCEFDSVASFGFPKRSFHYHATSILSLCVFESRLLSLSTDTLCIWCLRTGTMRFCKDTFEHYTVAIPYVAMQFWVMEHGECTRATLWDIEDEIPLRQVVLPEGEQYVGAFHIDGLSALVSNCNVTVWSEERVEREYTLALDGAVTCLCETPNGIAGGTAGGSVFMLDFDTEKVMQWTAIGGIVTTAMATLPGTNYIIVGDAIGHLTLWNSQTHAFERNDALSSASIEHIYVESIFAFVVHRCHVKLVSIIHERGALSCHSLHNIMTWSPVWKTKILSHITKHVKPVVTECLRTKKVLPVALNLIGACSEEYAHRPIWCDDKIVELLMDTHHSLSKTILKRLVAFKGPRIDCPICADSDNDDTVSFLPQCHHRFHTKCISEHIEKLPEHNEQMQYEYALSVQLRCPTCRAPFKPTDVKLDHLLNST